MNSLLFIALLFPFFFITACSDEEKTKEEETVKIFNYGNIATDPPKNWNIYHEIADYCVFLPKSFKPILPNTSDSLRRFEGPEGVLAIIHSTVSSGTAREKNGKLNDIDVAITQTLPHAQLPGAYHGAEMVYSFHRVATSPFYLDIVFYSREADQDLALQIFGSSRTSEECFDEEFIVESRLSQLWPDQ